MIQTPDISMTVDCGAVVANYHIIQKQAPTARCAAVVKANAYGLGLAPIAAALFQQGCDFFFVATLDEALELRRILPEATIAYFHGMTSQDQSAVCRAERLIPVMNTVESLSWVGDIPCMIHVDTGMNRLGISIRELAALKTMPYFPSLRLAGIMTHPACAEEVGHPMNDQQYTDFMECTRYFPSVMASYANSYAIFADQRMHFNLVRPGCALYGINPTPGNQNPMQPVVTLRTRVLQIRRIDRPSSVGYGASHQVPTGTILATIACGYADGYLRSAAGHAYCSIGAQKLPIIGRVSMDLMVVDVTAAKKIVQIGDELELIGGYISVDEVAQYAGTIGYEVFTRLGNRSHRIYKP